MTTVHKTTNEDGADNNGTTLVTLTLHEGQMLGAFKLIVRGPLEESSAEFPLNCTMAYLKRGNVDEASGVWMGNMYGEDTGELCTEFCDTVRSLVETVAKLYANDVARENVSNHVNKMARYVRNNTLVQLLPVGAVCSMLDDTRCFEQETNLISRTAGELRKRRPWRDGIDG